MNNNIVIITPLGVKTLDWRTLQRLSHKMHIAMKTAYTASLKRVTHKEVRDK